MLKAADTDQGFIGTINSVTGVEAVLEAVVDGQTQVLPWIELEVTIQDVEI